MDIKKDIQNRSALVSAHGIESTNILIGKKCDRLATALYLVTSFLSDSEPMKARLRALSLELVRDAAYVRYGTTSLEASVLDGIRANIGETLSLLELSFIAGIISEMNFSILKREYGTLRDKIEIKKASRESRTDNVLGDTFFGSSFSELEAPKITHANFPRNVSREVGNTPDSIGHSFAQKDNLSSPRPQSVVSETRPQAETNPVKKTLQADSKNTVHSLDLARESRRTRILKLIKDKREVTIKDITNHFPELSEKTIQRELIALVEAGVLKKFGERRWSRYSIA
jgi:DNA-binding transcriptional ArsR family regulator